MLTRDLHEYEGVIGGGVIVTCDLVLVLTGVGQREEVDCVKVEELRRARSQSPPILLNLMGGSTMLSGLSTLFLLTSDSVVSAPQDSSSDAGAGVAMGNRVEFCSGLNMVTSPVDSNSDTAGSRTKFIIAATSTPPLSQNSLRIGESRTGTAL